MTVSSSLRFEVKRQTPVYVAPAKRTPHEINQLSDIDAQEGLKFHVPFMFFFRSNPSMKGEDPVNVIREGLAKALVFYYPLAGRLIEGADIKLMVNCTGEGVMFIEADANIKLDQLGDDVFPPMPHMEELLYNVPGSEGIVGGPLLLIQVTRFICGGFALGIRFNHTMQDGYGMISFLNAISELVKGADSPSILPVWQRELLNARSPPRITCTHNEYEWTPDNKSALYTEDQRIRTSVFFGPKEIQSLRNKLSPEWRKCTRFELITACLWKCRTIALQPDSEETVRISFTINARGKNILDLPAGYYGNAFTYPAIGSKAKVLCESSLEYALNLVQQLKAQMSEEYIRSVADLMVIKKRPPYNADGLFIVSDLTRLGFDKVDFGWGKPLFGGIGWATSVISFYSTAKNGEDEGVVVPICLPPLAVKKFRSEFQKMIT